MPSVRTKLSFTLIYKRTGNGSVFVCDAVDYKLRYSRRDLSSDSINSIESQSDTPYVTEFTCISPVIN